MAIGGSSLGLGLRFDLSGNFVSQSKKVSSGIMDMQDKSVKAAERISQAMNKVSMAFLGAVAGIGALIAPFAIAVNKSAEFEAQMSDVGAKSRATGAELGALREQALALSSAQETANFTAKQVAEGQSFLAMAGFNTQQIMDSMQGTLFLAAAGSIELGRAADIASNTLAQFGLRANEMNRVADVIANAAVSSNQSVEQFADGMKFLGPTAKALGITLEEAAGTMMVLANSGLQGSLGTRALGTSLAARLTKPTRAAKDLMAELGFSAFNTKGEFVGVSNMVRRLDKSLGGLSPKMRQAAIATIFGGESIQEINTLLTQELEIIEDGQKVILKGADALDHFTKSNENAAGVAAKIARQKLDNLKGDFTILQSNIETTLIKIGAALTPILRPVTQRLSQLVSMFSSLLDTDFGKWSVIAVASLAAITAGIIGINFAVNTLIPSLWTMASAAAAAVAPLLPYIAIGIAIVGVIMMVNKGVDEFNELMASGKVKTGFLGFLQKLGGMTLGIIEIFKTWNGETFSMSKSMRDSMKKLGILDTFLTISTWVVRLIELFKGIGIGIKQGFVTVWNLIKPILISIGKLFGSMGLSVDKAFGSLESWLDVGKALGQFIAGMLIGVLIILIAKMVMLAVSVIAATWPILLIIAAIGAVVWAILNWSTVTDFLVEVWDAAVDWISEKWKGFTDWFFSLPKKFMAVGKSIAASIGEGISAGIQALKGMGESILKFIFGDSIGQKAADLLGLSSASSSNQNTNVASVGTRTGQLANSGARTIAEMRGIAASPEIINTESKQVILQEMRAEIFMDTDKVADKVIERDEFNISRD